MKWISGVPIRSIQPGDHLDRPGKEPVTEDMVVKVATENGGRDRVWIQMADGKDYTLSGEMIVAIWRPESEDETAMAMGRKVK